MLRRQYRPRPWKLTWLDRTGAPQKRAYGDQLDADREAYWLRTNGYREVDVTYVEPALERPRR